jgi:LacI family transcriptional regulator
VATLQDIATRANVSIATASHVISNKKRVSAKLRERVLKAVRELNYQPNAAARTLRTNRSSTVGIVIPDISDPFFPSLVRGAEDALGHGGYTLLIGNSDNDLRKEEDYLRTFREQQVDGMIVVASAENAPEFLRRQNLEQCPIVFADRAYADLSADLIEADNVGGSALAVNHLIQMGYRRIAIITGPLKLANARARLDGYYKALHTADIQREPAYVCEGDFGAVSARNLTKALLELPEPPDAIFATNAQMTLGAFQAMQDFGIECPGQMGLLSFDEQQWFDAVKPRISRLAHLGYEIGAGSAELLLKRIAGGMSSARVVRKLRCKLVGLESTNRAGIRETAKASAISSNFGRVHG